MKMRVTEEKIIEPLTWNGTILSPSTEMSNTCTVDNMLFASHVILKYREDIRNFMKRNRDPVINLLHEIHILFLQRKFAEGKLKWVQQFPQAKHQDKWDVWGSEENYSFSKLDCNTTYKTICTKDNCQQPVRIMTSRVICFK